MMRDMKARACDIFDTCKNWEQMVDDKEKTRREIEVLKQEVAKDLEAFREEFQGMTESLAAAKEATQESNAKLGIENSVH